MKQGRGESSRWKNCNRKSGESLKKLPLNQGSPWFFGMTDMTRDKSMRMVLMVLGQSMMEGYKRGGRQDVWLLLGLLSLGSYFTSALEV